MSLLRPSPSNTDSIPASLDTDGLIAIIVIVGTVIVITLVMCFRFRSVFYNRQRTYSQHRYSISLDEEDASAIPLEQTRSLSELCNYAVSHSRATPLLLQEFHGSTRSPSLTCDERMYQQYQESLAQYLAAYPEVPPLAYQPYGARV